MSEGMQGAFLNILCFSTSEAAKELGISVRRVQILLSTGRLHGQKVGNRWIVVGDSASWANYRKPVGRPKKQV